MSRKKPIPELAVYECDLPPPLELAKMADAIGPLDNYREALRNACKRYMEARQFHDEFKNATLEERALMFDDWKAAGFDALSAFSPELKGVLCPKRFPAPFDEFLSLVVGAKTPADCMKRLRDYLQNEFRHLVAYRELPAGSKDRLLGCYRNCCYFLGLYRKGQDELDFAAKQIERLRAGGLNEDQWDVFGCGYLAWWRQEKSKKASQSRCASQKLRRRWRRFIILEKGVA